MDYIGGICGVIQGLYEEYTLNGARIPKRR